MTTETTNGAPKAPSPEDIRRVRFLEDVVQNNLIFRQEMFTKLLDPRRNLEDECGYPQLTASIGADLYRLLYDRDPIANRVVSIYPEECWQEPPLVYEDEDTDTNTNFEEDWDALETNQANGPTFHNQEAGSSVWEHLKRGDKLSRIGHFGILLLGFDDGKNLQEPVDGTVEFTTNAQGKLTFNRANPLHGWPDSYMSEEEQRGMEQPRSREVWLGQYDLKGRPVNNVVVPPGLSKDEQRAVAEWARQRDIIRNQIQGVENGELSAVGPGVPDRGPVGSAGDRRNGDQPLAANGAPGAAPADATLNDAWGAMSGRPQNPGTDAQYAWQGSPTPGSLSGTDQQYFGVQFGPSEQMADAPPKRDKPMKLLFVRAYDESLVQIVRWEWNILNPRFGMPVMYRVTLNDPRVQHSGVGLPMATVFVHWSRVIHLAANLQSSEVMGMPQLQPVLNPVLDDRKIRGAGAEGYWKSCFTGLSYETHPQLGGDVLIDRQELRNTQESYDNGLQRALFTSGMTVKTIAPTVVDPGPQHEMQLEVICVQLGCPVRVFKGSERGELASSQDDSSWNDRVQAHRDGYVTPRVITPFIDRLIAVGVLRPPAKGAAKNTLAKTPTANRLRRSNGWLIFNGPVRPTPVIKAAKQTVPAPNADPDTPTGGKTKQPDPVPAEKVAGKPKSIAYVSDTGYVVQWPDIDSTTEAQKAQIALQFTQALAAFVQGGCEAAMAIKDWLVRVWHWDEEEAQEVVDAARSMAGQDAGSEDPLTMPPAGQDGHPATPPPKPPAPIVAPKAGVPAGTPGAPAGGIPAAKPAGGAAGGGGKGGGGGAPKPPAAPKGPKAGG